MPGWTCEVLPDLAGLPRVARLEPAQPRGRSASSVPTPRFPIRLLALDLDGTLVGPDLILRPRTRAAIRGALRRGVHVALATGRMSTSALPFAAELGLRDPIIAYQGALVREMPAAGRRLGRLVYHRPLPAAVARETVRGRGRAASSRT